MDKSAQARVEARRTTYLIAQARCILGMAQQDSDVAEAAGASLLRQLETDLGALESQIVAWRHSRQSAKALTMDEHRQAQRAVRWIVAFRRFYRVALARGEPLPSLPPGPPTTSRNATKVALEVGNLVRSGREHAASLTPVGCTPEFLARGERVMVALLDADERQEVAHAEARVEVRHRLLDLKLRVWTAVRAVVAVGQCVHAEEPLKAGAYNMRILYRGVAPPASADAAPPESGARAAS